MATLNELGKNSASITYNPSSSGQEQWPTFATVDKWLRNDTLQGTATGTGTTITGANYSLFNTQLKGGESVMLAGQLRTVNAPLSDTSVVVTSALSPAITAPSTLKVIGYTFSGTTNNSTTGYTNFPNVISGTVAISGDPSNTTVVGTNTYFMSDLTNSVTEVQLTGTGTVTATIDTNGTITGTNTQFTVGVPTSTTLLQPGDSIKIGTAYFVIATVTTDTSATVVVPPAVAITVGASIYKATNGVAGRTIVINGRVRQIASIANNTTLTVTVPFDIYDSNLKVKSYPRGTVGVTSGAANITSGNVTGANFYWDLPTSSQVWIGDELRTFAVTGKDTANLTAPSTWTGATFDGTFRQGVSNSPFRKDDTLIAYVNSGAQGALVLSQEIRVGDDIIINGTEATVVQIINDTLFRVGQDMPYIPAGSTMYKKKKIHGYVLEGTREGATSFGKFSTASYITVAATAGTNQITLNTVSGNNTQWNFVKIQNAGGPAVMLTGSVATSTNKTITGTSTKFQTELHVGAEVCIAGVYTFIETITSDSICTVNYSFSTGYSTTPMFRTVPLYTYITSATGNVLTLGTPLRNTLNLSAIAAAQSPAVTSPTPASGQNEFIEFVYSAPNKQAEVSITTSNQSLDRKYFGFRWWPDQNAATFGAADGAYNLVVYERWVASLGQAGGVGINKADSSDGTAALSGVVDRTPLTLTSGGFLYLFAKPRYFIIQGKSFSNIQRPWLGCIEFERAQPEDISGSSGIGTTGVSYFGSLTPTGTPNVSPWPCFAYFHSDRFPVGSSQVATAPYSYTTNAQMPNGIHGGIYSCPRIHVSSGDLVGLNAHVYTAATITTGRWGHLYEYNSNGIYTAPTSNTAGVLTATTGAIPMPHLGQLVPVNTNVYNSKRFMFSPVIVMGPTYDPDIRGRIFGLKIIPSALGSLMDTVSVTVDSVNDFYDSTATATDHWVVTSPGNSVTNSNTGVQTYRFSGVNANPTNNSPIPQYRSLEDPTNAVVTTVGTWLNNFRFAIPA